MSSAFDPSVFLQAQQTEVNEKRPPLPTSNPASEDGLYTAVITKVEAKGGTIEKGERAGQPWLGMMVQHAVQVPQQVQDAMKIKLDKGTLTITKSVFIDLTPDGKGIDNSVGRNRGQKQYREALDMNKPGDVFSWQAAVGRPVKVKIGHEMYEGEPQDRIELVLKP